MKYILEIKPEYEDSFKGVMILGAKDSNLFVDSLAVENLEELNSDYINEHYGSMQDEAYQKGLEEGKKAFDLLDAERDSEYQRGLDEAWEAARKIVLNPEEGGTSLTDLFALFGGGGSMQNAFRNYSASEVIEKLKAYEGKQKADDKIMEGIQRENDGMSLEDIDIELAQKCKRAFDDIKKALGIADAQEAKADAGKAQISLVPMEIVWAIAWIRMYGNRKYGDPENWKTVKPQRYRDALMRHILHYISDPESVDEESGYPHLWHAACNMAFLMHMDYGPMAYFDWNEELWEKVKKGDIG